MAKAKIQIYSKNGKFGRRYWTYMNILVKGEESKGKQRKSVTVQFRKNINTFNIKRGIIVGDIDAPFVYEITDRTDKNGKLVVDEKGTPKKNYPTVWVRSIDNYIEQVAKHEQSDFCIEDEEETDDTEIDETDSSIYE